MPKYTSDSPDPWLAAAAQACDPPLTPAQVQVIWEFFLNPAALVRPWRPKNEKRLSGFDSTPPAEHPRPER
jgi:hypothetical protein